MTPLRLLRHAYLRALVWTVRSWRRLNCRHLYLPQKRVWFADRCITHLRCFHCKDRRAVTSAARQRCHWEARHL